MATEQTYVIVGASLAGAKAAQSLRDAGADGRVVLVGDETERPYERPPLSKGYLIGKDERDKIYVHPEDWYAGHDVELRLGTTVTALDRSRGEVELSGGERLGYDRLLLATGASPRRLDLPGARAGGHPLPAPRGGLGRAARGVRRPAAGWSSSGPAGSGSR